MENQENSVSEQQNLILATTSPYRLEIFKRLGLHFTSEGSNVDEYTADRPSEPEALTQHLAKLKAESVAQNYTAGIVI
jgi:predicted house-cleaning NTP pyrophosphatase (Maf/HAM1 superfamily)